MPVIILHPAVFPSLPPAKPDHEVATVAPAELLRLVGLGLGRPSPDSGAVEPATGSTSPNTRPANILDEVLLRQGPFAVVRLGEGIANAREEPTAMALAAATCARDLMSRWQRLEAYAHSRHRIRFHAWGEHQLTVDRYAVDATQRVPFAAELLVHGMLAVLLERVLATPVDMHLVASGQLLRTCGRWQWQANPVLQAGVEFRWTPRPERSPVVRIDSSRTRDTIRERLLADPARNWLLAELANELGLATRTLQRRLRQEGCCFAELVQDARATHASRLLTHSCESIAAIGFVAGYADQPHFTREFKRRTAMTPALFRSAYSVVLNPLTCPPGRLSEQPQPSGRAISAPSARTPRRP